MLSIEDGGIALNAMTSTAVSLSQRFPKGYFGDKKYTLAFQDIHGEKYLENHPILTNQPGFDYIQIATTGWMKFVWVALYEGVYTLDTLPEYQPKGYEAELLICRQYDHETGKYIGLRKFNQPYNLLDNSDFRNPVNQRGRDSYTGAEYVIDRWYKESNAVAILGNNGIQINNTNNSAPEVFVQETDSKTANYLIDRQVKITLAIKTDQGIFCGSGTVTTNVPVATIRGDGWTLTLHFFYRESDPNSSSYQTARLIVNKGKSVLVEWIALYEGEYTLDTLPEYNPKGYGAELAECQRYFFRIGNENSGITALGVGHINTENSVALYIPFPATMRIRAISIGLHGSIQLRSADNFYTASVVRANIYGTNGILIWVDTEAAINNVGGAADCWLTEKSYLEFSANL